MGTLFAIGMKFWPYLAAAGAALTVLMTTYLKGRGDANAKTKARKAKSDAKANERINKRNPVDPADKPDVLRRLRDHAKR